MPSNEVRITFPARPYQRPVVDFYRKGGKRAYCVWHRKAGKDRTATFVESELAFKRVGLYWHALPKYEDARKVIWDAITPDGKRLIDVNFPAAIVKRRLDHEMKLELVNGSIWQPVGADNFDNLVGAFPVHVTYSEYALMDPRAREFLRPAIAMNDGTELIITTPRGYNHAHELWKYAQSSKEWFTSLLTYKETNVVPPHVIEEEKRTMPDELFRQEWECDWSAANIGSILGRYIEAAEKSGRVREDVDLDADGAGVEISSDIGFRDTSSFWFWQPKVNGFSLVDYDEDSGLDASEWIPRLKERLGKTKLEKIWLPHDAKAKTFQSRHSVVEQFLSAFGRERVDIVPEAKKQDRINAARLVIPRCEFNSINCDLGLDGLRNWSFEWNEEKKTFSKEPKHDWASHPGDAFSYGAQVMRERVIEQRKILPIEGLAVGETNKMTLNEMWKQHDRKTQRRARI